MHSASATWPDKNKRVEFTRINTRSNIIACFISKQRGLQRSDRVSRMCVSILIEHIWENKILDELERSSTCSIVTIKRATQTKRSYKFFLITYLVSKNGYYYNDVFKWKVKIKNQTDFWICDEIEKFLFFFVISLVEKH